MASTAASWEGGALAQRARAPFLDQGAPERTEVWYGLPTLVADGASAITTVVGYAMEDSVVMAIGGGGYLLGTWVGHGRGRRWGRAWAMLGIRLASLLLGGFAGRAAACADVVQGESTDPCSRFGFLVGGGGLGLLVAVLDIGVFSWERDPDNIARYW